MTWRTGRQARRTGGVDDIIVRILFGPVKPFLAREVRAECGGFPMASRCRCPSEGATLWPSSAKCEAVRKAIGCRCASKAHWALVRRMVTNRCSAHFALPSVGSKCGTRPWHPGVDALLLAHLRVPHFGRLRQSVKRCDVSSDGGVSSRHIGRGLSGSGSTLRQHTLPSLRSGQNVASAAGAAARACSERSRRPNSCHVSPGCTYDGCVVMAPMARR